MANQVYDLHGNNHIIKAFDDAGVPVVVVGGTCRDAALRRDSSDVDLATPLLPEQVIAKVEDQIWCDDIILTGLKHGTIMINIVWGGRLENLPGFMVEVTTYRVDKECDGRHAEVEFTRSLEDDLSRRDFTINAMAWDGTKLIDPHHGAADCAASILRTVGDPYLRFEEDYLRVIRLFRFEALLRFNIEDATLDAAMKANIASRIKIKDDEVKPVAIERVIIEFNKVFKQAGWADCETFLQRMYDLGIMNLMFPELQMGPVPCHELLQSPKYHPEGDVWTHMSKVVGCAQDGYEPGHPANISRRWIAMLHDIAKPMTAEWDPKYIGNKWYSFYGHDKKGAEIIPDIIKRLKLPKELGKVAALVARWHLYIYSTPPSKKAVRKVQNAMGDYLPALKYLGEADHMGRPLSDDVEKYFIPQPHVDKEIITGDDLKKLGCKEGPELGRVKNAVFKVQIEDGITNKNKLLEVARGQINGNGS